MIGSRPLPQAHLDALARQQGFHDYATWSAYQARESARIHGPANAGAAGAAPKNWLQNLAEHIPLHPAMLLHYVDQKLSGATGQ